MNGMNITKDTMPNHVIRETGLIQLRFIRHKIKKLTQHKTL